jgi:hypothetical protein
MSGEGGIEVIIAACTPDGVQIAAALFVLAFTSAVFYAWGKDAGIRKMRSEAGLPNPKVAPFAQYDDRTTSDEGCDVRPRVD